MVELAAAAVQKLGCCVIDAACSALAWAASDESAPNKGAAKYAAVWEDQMERICCVGAVALSAVVEKTGARMS